MRTIQKPKAGEYPEYARIYMDRLADDGRVLEHLGTDAAEWRELLTPLPEPRLQHRYAPGKWTIKQVLAHVVDDERIYVYRALRYARGDTTELPGFDQELFAAESAADERPVFQLLDELAAVREATIAFFEGLPDAAFTRAGTGDGSRATVRALAYHIAGHSRHHLALVRERYLEASG